MICNLKRKKKNQLCREVEYVFYVIDTKILCLERGEEEWKKRRKVRNRELRRERKEHKGGKGQIEERARGGEKKKEGNK